MTGDDRQRARLLNYPLRRKLGAGGQGVVYLTQSRGSDRFSFPAALKIFSPERFSHARSYEASMKRMSRVTSLVARAHRDNLVGIHAFGQCDQIRFMLMEWVEGFDLRRLVRPRMLRRLSGRVTRAEWKKLNDVVITEGPEQARLQPGIVIAIIRDCLAGLIALHSRRIVHGDIKPSNIMIKRIGIPKIIDLGSAFELDSPPQQRVFTRAYAAPEVRERFECTPQSDLVSLGYVMIELLTGRRLFHGAASAASEAETRSRSMEDARWLQDKKSLPHRLATLMPDDVVRNEPLMDFCRRLIHPDPEQRFETAVQAEVDGGCGAFEIYKSLVRGDLAVQFQLDIQHWIESLLRKPG
jgi:serine/threonine-protein kinase